MKKKTKILIALFFTLLLLSSAATLSFASESGETDGESQLDSAPETNENPSEKPNGASGENPNEKPDGSLNGNTDENVFDIAYGFFTENADKIFSCLAFIGALILSFAYKKGLFPFVEKALSSLGGAVKALREETEKNSLEKNEFMKKLSEKLLASEKILEGSSRKISELEEKLSEAMALGDKTEEFRAVMLAEVEMIYDIFTSSSLPQYQKDKVGEAYLRMKRALGEKEG